MKRAEEIDTRPRSRATVASWDPARIAAPARPESDRSPLQGYLRTLARRKLVVIQAVVLAALGATFLSIREQTRYQATASVLLADESIAAPLTGSATPGAQRDRIIQTEADLARLPAVADRVLRAVPRKDLTTEQFLARSSVSTRVNSDILDFRVVDPSAAQSTRLATEYGRQFTIYRRQLEASALERAQGQLQHRIDELKSRGVGRAAIQPLERRIHDLTVRQALGGSEALLVRPATSSHQVQPRPVRDVVLGVVLGVIVGVALAFLWDALDTRVRRVEEVGERLGLPLLGRLREPSRRLRNRAELVMQVEPHGSDAEAFRILRANLDFANVDGRAKVVMITGAVDGDGRSTTIANLAVACALAGRHVVLVDLNLRHPILGRLFAVDGRPGLTDVALGHAELDDALTAATLRNPGEQDSAQGVEPAGVLEVLPSGPVPLDSGEFAASRTVAEVIDDLRGRADLVFVDAPPLLPVGDARILSGVVDALLVVTNLALINRPMLDELRTVLDVCPTRVLGFIATGMKESEEDRYGGYYERRAPHAGRVEERAA
jgi:capsular exopolysaccharide synthesis family protein